MIEQTYAFNLIVECGCTIIGVDLDNVRYIMDGDRCPDHAAEEARDHR